MTMVLPAYSEIKYRLRISYTSHMKVVRLVIPCLLLEDKVATPKMFVFDTVYVHYVSVIDYNKNRSARKSLKCSSLRSLCGECDEWSEAMVWKWVTARRAIQTWIAAFPSGVCARPHVTTALFDSVVLTCLPDVWKRWWDKVLRLAVVQVARGRIL